MSASLAPSAAAAARCRSTTSAGTARVPRPAFRACTTAGGPGGRGRPCRRRPGRRAKDREPGRAGEARRVDDDELTVASRFASSRWRIRNATRVTD